MTKNKEGAGKPDPDKHSKNANNRINISGVLEKVLQDMNPESFEASLTQVWADLSNDERSRIKERIMQLLGDYDPRKSSGNGLIFDEWNKLLQKYFDVETKTDKGQKIDTGEIVYFTNFKRIHVSQGFTEDRMFITVPLFYDRPILDRASGNVLYTKKELANFIVTSNHEILKPSDSYFQGRNIIAEIPKTIMTERWSMGSISDFYNKRNIIDPKTVFSKLTGIWHYFMDLSGNPGAYTALPLIDVLSYCIWLFQYAPYVKYEGEKGSSKSKACEIHEYIDFNAFSGVDLTPAVIFRTLQDTRGTLIIDEAETYDKLKNKSEYEQAREAIINTGFKVNGKVSRIERDEDHFSRVDYHVFGIKIIGSIHGVSETIRDRSYQIILIKTLDKEISKRTPKHDDPMFQEARDMLYLLVLNHWKEIKEIAENADIGNRLGLIGREWDKAFPLLVLATFFAKHDQDHGQEIIDDLWLFLKDQKNREIALTIDTFDEVVIDQVEQAIRNEAKRDKLTEMDDRNFDLKLPDVSLAIATLEGKNGSRNFNLRNYSRSIKNKIQKLAIGENFRHGTDNVTVFTSNLKFIADARKRYSISPSSEKKQDAFNSINFTNLINSINSFNSELIEINRNLKPENSINSSLTKENTDSLMKGINQLIELIARTSTSSTQNTLEMTEKPTNSDVQNEKRYELPQYKSPDLVLKNLKKWGFEVIEYQKVIMSKDEWKARINGVFESFPEDKQQYLDKMFDVRSRGSINSPYVWIRFRVEGQS